MPLTLHDRGVNLHNLGGLVAVLLTQTVHKSGQGRLRGRVSRQRWGRDEPEVGTRDDESRRLRLGLQAGQKLHGQVDDTGEVDIDLVVEAGKVELGGARQARAALDARVQQDAVQVRVVGEGPDCSVRLVVSANF